MSIVTRIAALGLVLAMFAGVQGPGTVPAQSSGKVLIMGSLGEPDTFIGVRAVCTAPRWSAT